MKSFGVPYMAPVAPKTTRGGFDIVLRGPVYEQELRPDELNTKNRRRQHQISRRWILEKPVGKGE
jgi:spore germination protein KA